ncbi:MAG TPA: DoxX family protein [Candidatus Paceibacterota bacterium]
MEFLFLIGRVLFGALFVYNGWSHLAHNTSTSLYAQSKDVPMPRITVFVTGIAIIAGGLGIILGIYVKLSVFLLAFFLLGTLVKVHTFWKHSDMSSKAQERNEFLKNAALLGALLMFLSVLEPWSLSF